MKHKKTVFKTILCTLCVMVILAVAAFGMASLIAPAAMMRFTAGIGLTTMSGDYAFQEYERSGDIACLARSFIISADAKNYRTAASRFSVLYDKEQEKFTQFCERQDETLDLPAEMEGYTYRSYICGLGATVMYHLAAGEREYREAADFAIAETPKDFPAGNPVVALAIEAIHEEDEDFCGLLLTAIEGAGFDGSAELYRDIVSHLGEQL